MPLPLNRYYFNCGGTCNGPVLIYAGNKNEAKLLADAECQCEGDGCTYLGCDGTNCDGEGLAGFRPQADAVIEWSKLKILNYSVLPAAPAAVGGVISAIGTIVDVVQLLYAIRNTKSLEDFAKNADSIFERLDRLERGQAYLAQEIASIPSRVAEAVLPLFMKFEEATLSGVLANTKRLVSKRLPLCQSDAEKNLVLGELRQTIGQFAPQLYGVMNLGIVAYFGIASSYSVLRLSGETMEAYASESDRRACISDEISYLRQFLEELRALILSEDEAQKDSLKSLIAKCEGEAIALKTILDSAPRTIDIGPITITRPYLQGGKSGTEIVTVGRFYVIHGGISDGEFWDDYNEVILSTRVDYDEKPDRPGGGRRGYFVAPPESMDVRPTLVEPDIGANNIEVTHRVALQAVQVAAATHPTTMALREQLAQYKRFVEAKAKLVAMENALRVLTQDAEARLNSLERA